MRWKKRSVKWHPSSEVSISLVNNASAINLAPTEKATVKSYDLMNGINARGSWLVSRFALPHLLHFRFQRKQSAHLDSFPSTQLQTLSHPTLPPSATKRRAHFPQQIAQTASAYTIAKFGMSLLTLGLSAETIGKIGVNSLWPYTLIATSAMKIVSKDASSGRNAGGGILQL